jgi:drug/metabolite transporter (DMT)-like permease
MNPTRGIVIKLLATFLFAIMSALIRAMADRYPVGQLVFVRSFFAMLPVVVVIAWRGEMAGALKMINPMSHLARGLVGTAGMFTTFLALRHLPLADATAIGFATPLIAVVLAVIFLGEVVRAWRWSAVGIGFLGVLVMLWPHLGSSGFASATATGALWGIAGAFFSASAMTLVRAMTRSESTWSIVFWFSALCAVMGLLTAPFGWLMPAPVDAAVFVLMGLVGGVAQLLLTASYRHASAAMLAPFDYFALIFAVAIGYVVFGEVPAVLVLWGAALVVSAGLFVIWREHRLGLERARAREAQGPTPGA